GSTWMGQLGSSLKDGGNPFTPASKTISNDGSISDSGGSASGYSILSADSLDAATEMAKGCPVLQGGATITVYETFSVMGGRIAERSRGPIRPRYHRARRLRLGGRVLGYAAGSKRDRARTVRARARTRRIRGSLADHPAELLFGRLRPVHAAGVRDLGGGGRRVGRGARADHRR